jgi:hypothetical protein
MRVIDYLLGEENIKISGAMRDIITEHIKEYGCVGDCNNCKKYLDDECMDFESRHIVEVKVNQYSASYDNDYGDSIGGLYFNERYGLTKRESELLGERYEKECGECVTTRLKE